MISTSLGRVQIPGKIPIVPTIFSWVNWERDPEREIRGGNRTAVVPLDYPPCLFYMLQECKITSLGRSVFLLVEKHWLGFFTPR